MFNITSNFSKAVEGIRGNRMLSMTAECGVSEVLRITGLNIIGRGISKVRGFMPFKAQAVMKHELVEPLLIIGVSQLLGNSAELFRGKLSPENQQYLDFVQKSMALTSASTLVGMANVDRLFDAIFPPESKALMDDAMKQISAMSPASTDPTV